MRPDRGACQPAATQRQYALPSKATATSLGWSTEEMVVLGEDARLSGSGNVERSGFVRLTAEAALGHTAL